MDLIWGITTQTTRPSIQEHIYIATMGWAVQCRRRQAVEVPITQQKWIWFWGISTQTTRPSIHEHIYIASSGFFSNAAVRSATLTLSSEFCSALLQYYFYRTHFRHHRYSTIGRSAPPHWIFWISKIERTSKGSLSSDFCSALLQYRFYRLHFRQHCY
jgi:hypothetical protein